MPIQSIFWSGSANRDLHVVRGGTSRDLTDHALMFVRDDDTVASADDYLVTVADVTLKFTPLFKGTQQGSDFIGHLNGITVSTTLGIVTVAAAIGINVKSNFIIEVEAKNDGDGKTFFERIRVHVHGFVSQVWLTPDLLTIRPTRAVPEATTYRFSVRAEFDDGVVGDISEGHGVTWNSPDNRVASTGDFVMLTDDKPGDKFFVSATLPIQLGGATTPVGPTVEIGQPWKDDPSRPKVTIVPGGGLPQTGAAEDAPNILIFGDGFRSEDQDSFNRIADTLVHYLTTNQLSLPYPLLSGRMNFWKTFVPSSEIGISYKSEMYLFGIQPFARPLPLAIKPPATGQWNVNNVLYGVGLPVPADRADARTPAFLKEEWAELLQTDPSPNISDDVVLQWKALAKRTLIEERDGFPGMQYGFLPAANLFGDPMTNLNLNFSRAGLTGLNAFYQALSSDDVTLADGRPVGFVWAEKTFRFDNTDLVVLITAVPGGRALNADGYMAMTTKGFSVPIPLKPVPGKNVFTLDMTAAPSDVEGDISRTIAHELGHSFGLGDEYAEGGRGFYPFPHAEERFPNLQKETDTQIPDPSDPTKKIISGDEINWIWHRIKAAAVVNGDITSIGLDTFRIPLTPDISFRFVKDDVLFIRARTWGVPLRKFTGLEVSGPLIIIEPPEIDAIVVRAVHVISATLHPPGSLVYIPKPAPASVVSIMYPYAEMIAKNVKDAITANRKPLTVVPCVIDESSQQYPILDAVQGRTAVANIPNDVAWDPTRIVGLYAGGSLYSCGIFHPTGQCMMRNSSDSSAQFCAVCRYIMVDLIGPDLHPEIDAYYDKIYPQR